MKIMWIIQDQLMKNFLTHWNTKKENQNILNIFGKKSSNLVNN